MRIKLPKFYLKLGRFGDGGWVQVPWYMWLVKAADHVNKVEWT